MRQHAVIQRTLVPILLAASYMGFTHLIQGIRMEHLLLVSFLLLLTSAHHRSRQFVRDFLPFAIFGILYDLLRVFPKEWAGPIHVEVPYRIEAFLFGWVHEGQLMIPCDWFQIHHHPILDVITAAAYSGHMIVPLGFAFFSWIKNRPVCLSLGRAFLVANLFAFATYILLPVAPPWYVEQFGFRAGDWSTIGSAAGLTRFDLLIGRPYWESIYAKSAWVFGAVPSMHAGFPLLTILFAHKVFRKGVIPFYLFMGLVWFSAVYLGHHYVIDLLAGVLYVLAAYFLMSLYEKIFTIPSTTGRTDASGP